MDDKVYQDIIEALQQALAYTRGEIELPSNTYTLTFPDCPQCWNMNDNECIFKDECMIQISEDGECRIGTPSKYTSISDGEKIIDAFNAIGCTSFLMTADEIRQIISTQNTDDTDSLQEVEIS